MHLIAKFIFKHFSFDIWPSKVGISYQTGERNINFGFLSKVASRGEIHMTFLKHIHYCVINAIKISQVYEVGNSVWVLE